MASELHLSAGAYALDLEPEEGGAVARFDWNGVALFRPRCGNGPLNASCFPLAPFSNRIAFGRFSANGRAIELTPNFPGSDHPHVLHGFGWLKPWAVQEAKASSATLSYHHDADSWPWTFAAEQKFSLSPNGLRHDISIQNLGSTAMPAGVGVHPYFARTPRTRYVGLHRGEWRTSSDGLPLNLSEKEHAEDWWQGQSVSARAVDTVYIGREGPLMISWPERNVRLFIEPSPELSFTTVYTPADADFFCIEPVSHETNAVNSAHSSTGLRWLEPGENFAAHIIYVASRDGAEQQRSEN